jgi:type IV pilus assembly protein PilB
MHDQDVFLERALLAEKLIDQTQMVAVKRHCAENDTDLVDGLVATETLSSRQLGLVRAEITETPFVDLDEYEPCFANTSLVPRSLAERHTVFPLFMIDNVLTLAMDDPLNLQAADQIRQLVRCDVDPVLCERGLLQDLISRAYSLSHERDGDIQRLQSEDDEIAALQASEPVIAAVNQILGDAVEQRASDVHINPDEHVLHLRYRVDGCLQPKQGPPLSMHSSIVQRLKVMATLDLTQTRRPQDGKFRYRHNGQDVDVRVSTIPTVCGENVVMRLLAISQAVHEFHDLGVPPSMVNQIEDLISHPHGMMLVTGPTGSGKTTTLYTALSRLNDPSRNVMTIEDPVELRLPYVRQIQTHAEIGLTFSAALRSMLRQDPDVILVGEIRDEETATIAMQAALTGHLVLSTLHTNDAVGAVARLRDYGLPSFVINSALLGVVAQRLVRRVCTHCVAPAEIDEFQVRRFRLESTVGLVEGKGCSRCAQTGYRGRVGLFELLPFTEQVRSLIETGDATDRIRAHAIDGGMRLMWQDGLDKARQGLTTLDEIAAAASVIILDDQVDKRMAA